MREIFLIGIAGALGSVSRYWVSGWTYQVFGERFPYGTLAVNLLGCLLIGFVMQVGLNTEILTRTARVAIAVGFLGAFTTLSTVSYETLRLLQDGIWWAALGNMGMNLGIGLAATWAGFSLARAIIGGS